MRLEPISVDHLGYVNPNTAISETSLPVYAIEVPDQEVAGGDKGSEGEFIERAFFQDYGEIREDIARGDISCGLTLASLMYFETNKDTLI